MRRAVLPILLVAISASVLAAPPPVRIAGIYSDMYYHEEAGDVLGMEVWITPAEGAWYAVVQMGEGEPSIPVVVPITVNGASVSFQLPERFGNLRFSGRVTKSELVGTLGEATVHLRRGKSYWQ